MTSSSDSGESTGNDKTIEWNRQLSCEQATDTLPPTPAPPPSSSSCSVSPPPTAPAECSQLNEGAGFGQIELLSNPKQDCRHRGRQCGYAPSGFVQPNNSEAAKLPGWLEANRQDVEKLLLLPGRPCGVYLLGPGADGGYTLSVRVAHATKRKYFFVQHFPISCTPSYRYCINQEVTFRSVRDLLIHYTGCADGMPCKLLRPCSFSVPTARMDDLEVNADCIKIEQKIGSGSFSDVYQAKWHDSLTVVVKISKLKESNDMSLLQEARLMVAAHHPHVLQIMGICTKADQLCIITELMTNGSLLDFLRNGGKGAQMEYDQLVKIMIQLADAMCRLEALRIVHRDLRAANSLVSEDFKVKLGDFGIARQLDKTGVYFCAGDKVPIKWTPVEAATKSCFTVKSDVWSFGVLMWEIVTYGGHPYAGRENWEVIEMIASGYRMPKPQGGRVQCDQSIYLIMLECWNSDPEKRPSFSRLKEILLAYAAVRNALKKIK